MRPENKKATDLNHLTGYANRIRKSILGLNLPQKDVPTLRALKRAVNKMFSEAKELSAKKDIPFQMAISSMVITSFAERWEIK